MASDIHGGTHRVTATLDDPSHQLSFDVVILFLRLLLVLPQHVHVCGCESVCVCLCVRARASTSHWRSRKWAFDRPDVIKSEQPKLGVRKRKEARNKTKTAKKNSEGNGETATCVLDSLAAFGPSLSLLTITAIPVLLFSHFFLLSCSEGQVGSRGAIWREALQSHAGRENGLQGFLFLAPLWIWAFRFFFCLGNPNSKRPWNVESSTFYWSG